MRTVMHFDVMVHMPQYLVTFTFCVPHFFVLSFAFLSKLNTPLTISRSTTVIFLTEYVLLECLDIVNGTNSYSELQTIIFQKSTVPVTLIFLSLHCRLILRTFMCQSCSASYCPATRTLMLVEVPHKTSLT